MAITASRIPDETREVVMSMYHGYCGVYGCTEKAIEIHHRMPNTKSNVIKYPLFINSPINLFPIDRKHHLDGKVLKMLKWNDHQANIFENYLRGVL